MTSKSIVAAVDGSDASLQAVRVAAGLADATGRDLKLLYVYPYLPTGVHGLELIDRERLDEIKQKSAAQVFDAALAHLGSRPQAPGKILLWGDPAEEIIEYMKANPGTHLVLGRRGLSKIKALLLGSVSEKVLRHAPGLVTLAGD